MTGASLVDVLLRVLSGQVHVVLCGQPIVVSACCAVWAANCRVSLLCCVGSRLSCQPAVL